MVKVQKLLVQKNIQVLLAILFVLSTLAWFGQDKPNGKDMSISQFLYELRNQSMQIEKIVIYENEDFFSFISEEQQYIVPVPKGYFESSNSIFESIAFGYFGNMPPFDMEIKRGINWGTLFLIAVIILITGYIVHRMLRKYSHSPYLVHVKEIQGLNQMVGNDSVKEYLEKIILAVRNSINLDAKTILLDGPPGNGKRSIVLAAAKDARVPLLRFSASQLNNEKARQEYVKRTNLAWKKAKKPVFVLLEIDDMIHVNNTVQLTKGLNTLECKALLFAVYDQDRLPSANLEGFDYRIHMNSPGLLDRKEILDYYLNHENSGVEPVSAIWEEQYLDLLSKQTEGFSHKELKDLVKTAQSIAMKKLGQPVMIAHLREALSLVRQTSIANRTVSQEEKRVMAYHQAGHAVAQMILSPKGVKGVSHITLSPNGESIGHVSYVTEDRVYTSKSELIRKIQVLFAGRVAEEILLDGDVTNLAENDLKQANSLIYQFVTKYGMSESLNGCYIEDHHHQLYLIQDEINKTRESLYKQTKELLTEHAGKIENIARHLIQYSFIEEYQIERILDGASY